MKFGFGGKCDKTIAGHQPLTTANDKTMVGGFVSFRCHTQLCHIDGWTTLKIRVGGFVCFCFRGFSMSHAALTSP